MPFHSLGSLRKAFDRKALEAGKKILLKGATDNDFLAATAVVMGSFEIDDIPRGGGSVVSDQTKLERHASRLQLHLACRQKNQ